MKSGFISDEEGIAVLILGGLAWLAAILIGLDKVLVLIY